MASCCVGTPWTATKAEHLHVNTRAEKDAGVLIGYHPDHHSEDRRAMSPHRPLESARSELSSLWGFVLYTKHLLDNVSDGLEQVLQRGKVGRIAHLFSPAGLPKVMTTAALLQG
ncbi:hypothetical protein DEDE109153_02275 [Deinococcus deserti]